MKKEAGRATRAPRLASEIKPRAIEFLWRERIPKGMITVVAGKPDQGKGLFAAHVAADVSKRGGKVLYSAAEDTDELMTGPRLEAAGANLDNVIVWRFRLPVDREEMEALVRDMGISLIVMDPFAAHLSNGVSAFSDSVRDVTGPMEALAGETGVSFLVIEHALKRINANAHPLTAIRGSSSGLPAASRMGFVFGADPDDDDRRLLCNVKKNVRDEPDPIEFEMDSIETAVGDTPSLLYIGETQYNARKLLADPKGDGKVGRRPEKRAAAAEWLTKYLAASNEPVKAGEVIEDARINGFPKNTLLRAAKDMQVVRQPPGGGRNCTWDLPQDVKDALGIGGGQNA